MDKLTFCKIPNEEGTKFYNVKAEWSQGEFSISILDNASAWKGVVDSSEIEQFSKQHNTTVEEYINECQVAFSSDGPEKFVYATKNQRRVEETVIVLVWKKIVNSDIKLKYGSVCLRPLPLDCFINDVWNVLDEMSRELTGAKRAREEFQCEKEMLFDRIRGYQELKLEMEKTLYAKFLLILNAKKKKIEELEAQLSENTCVRTSGVDAPEDGIKMERVGKEGTSKGGRKDAARSRAQGRARGKPTPRRKPVEVISPLDSLPPSQTRPKVDLDRGASPYDPEYDDDTEVDEPEPTGPSTSGCHVGSGRALAGTEVKDEVSGPDTCSENFTTFPNDRKQISEVEAVERGGDPPRRRESNSSTDIDDFLAQDDELPLSMVPKRSRRPAHSSGSVPGTSRGVFPVAPRTDVHMLDTQMFDTQELLEDL